MRVLLRVAFVVALLFALTAPALAAQKQVRRGKRPGVAETAKRSRSLRASKRARTRMRNSRRVSSTRHRETPADVRTAERSDARASAERSDARARRRGARGELSLTERARRSFRTDDTGGGSMFGPLVGRER